MNSSTPRLDHCQEIVPCTQWNAGTEASREDWPYSPTATLPTVAELRPSRTQLPPAALAYKLQQGGVNSISAVYSFSVSLLKAKASFPSLYGAYDL